MDVIDRSILRVLALYDNLTLLQLWYELGEDNAVRVRVTEAEIIDRLDSLKASGLVETIARARSGGRATCVGYRIAHAVSD